MKEAGTKSRQLKALRHRAEALLHEKPQALSNIPPEDIQQLIHELQVHQIELEMQNEELTPGAAATGGSARQVF